MQKKINIRYSNSNDHEVIAKLKNKFSFSTTPKLISFLLKNYEENIEKIEELKNENISLKIQNLELTKNNVQ